MNSKTISHLIAILAVMMALLSTGCAASVVGASLGLIVDHHNGRTRHVTYAGTDSLLQGTQVIVTLRNGSCIVGENLGTAPRPLPVYQSAFDSVRSARSQEIALPSLGDSVSVSNMKSTAKGWRFTGFGPEALALSDKNRDTTTTYLPLQNVSRWQSRNGAEFDVLRVHHLMQERALPLNRELNVKSGPRTFNIPLESVQQVDCPGHNTEYWLLGASIGFVVDATIFFAYLSAGAPGWM